MNTNIKHIIPTPLYEKREDKKIKIGRICLADFKLVFESEGLVYSSAKDYILKKLEEHCATKTFDGDYIISFRIDENDKRLADKSDESYAISVGESEANLVSKTDRGTYYAAVTFIDLLEVRGEGVYLPVCEIVDSPKFKTRGPYFESRYNEFMTLDDWCGAVDYLAGMKDNIMCVGAYTCWSYQYDKQFSEFLYLPIDKRPELKIATPRKYYSVKNERWVVKEPELPTMVKEDFFGELVKYGKTKNVEVFPLFNSLGHNTVLPRIYPEVSAVDENGNKTGFGMCTRNPKTYELMFDIYDSIVDKYLLPNGVYSINIGLDEVQPMTALDKEGKRWRREPFCKCEKCRNAEFIDLFCEYVIELLKYLKKKGMKNVYICYDMLFNAGILNEKFEQMLKDNDVYDITVIVWWGYGAGPDFFRGKGDMVNGLFRSIIMPMAGYENWTCFSDNTENIAEDAALAEKIGAEGMFSYCTYDKMYEYNNLYHADACWSPTNGDFLAHRDNFVNNYLQNIYSESSDEALAAWLYIQHFMHPYNYSENPPHNAEYMPYGFSYVKSDTAYPREYLSELFVKIEKDKERHLGYLREFTARAETALSFFNSSKAAVSKKSEFIKLNITHLSTQYKMILTLFELYERCKVKAVSKAELARVFDELIANHRALMLMHENIRLQSTLHHPLRILSTVLEYLCECRERIVSGEIDGYYPAKMIDKNAPVFEFLR